MNPIALGGPTVEPVSLAEMKAHLRLDGSDEDDLVSALVVAARVRIELHTRLTLISQRWRYALSGWPGGSRVRLPFQPVLAIDAVRVSNESGPATVLAPLQYRLDEDGDVARLVVAPGAPDAEGKVPRIEIDVTCGFGASADKVPEPLRLAIRRLAGFWFEHRGDERGPGDAGLPPDILALVAPYCRARLA